MSPQPTHTVKYNCPELAVVLSLTLTLEQNDLKVDRN